MLYCLLTIRTSNLATGIRVYTALALIGFNLCAIYKIISIYLFIWKISVKGQRMLQYYLYRLYLGQGLNAFEEIILYQRNLLSSNKIKLL